METTVRFKTKLHDVSGINRAAAEDLDKSILLGLNGLKQNFSPQEAIGRASKHVEHCINMWNKQCEENMQLILENYEWFMFIIFKSSKELLIQILITTEQVDMLAGTAYAPTPQTKNTLQLMAAFDLPDLPDNRAEVYMLTNCKNKKLLYLIESPVCIEIVDKVEQLFFKETFAEPTLHTIGLQKEGVIIKPADLYRRKVNYFEALEWLEQFNINN